MQRTPPLRAGIDPSSFSVRCAAFGTTISVTVTGEVDLSTIDEFAAAINGALNLAPEIVTVDLSQVSFFDCTGLHALVAAHQRAVTVGIEMVLIPGPPEVMRLFELCRLLDLLPFSALAKLHARSEATAA